MRVLTVGRFIPKPAMLGNWLLIGETDQDRAAIKHEAEHVYGFVLDPENQPEIDPASIIFVTSEGTEQTAWLLQQIDHRVVFFIHEFVPGGRLLIEDVLLDVPPVTFLPPEVSDLYYPPSIVQGEAVPGPRHFAWQCSKCRSTRFTLSELRGSSGALTAYMDWDCAIFTAVSCFACGFTDFYREQLSVFIARYNISEQLIEEYN